MTSSPAASPGTYGPSGIDLAELDAGIRPQDDLFRHVNGRWIDRTEIPADKARYGSFAVLAENAEFASEIDADEAKADAGSDDPQIAARGRARLRALGQLD